MRNAKGPPPLTGAAAEQEMRRLTRRSFLVGGAAAVAGIGSWAWLTNARTNDGVPWPLRRALRFNESFVETLGAPHHLAPTFPRESVTGPARINGPIGLDGNVVAAGWQLNVQHEGKAFGQSIRLSDVLALPRVDLVTEFKCVEGWSEIMHFSGVRFVDFVTKFGLGTRSGQPPNPAGNPQDLFRNVFLATPDEDYYVGLDMASALHPQTLLCDTMNGQPLSREHGAPLRLYLPVKYGYKSLKRVSLIRFQDTRPSDYWVERGYDWYAGL
jgi:DMSO/TMAO reductase YedYZ molybdopterin-dependent catalytic subunit